MTQAGQALVFGLASALSLPFGALVGMSFFPVSEKTTGCFMAFGSGAVVFAVATQLYGDALSEFEAAARYRCPMEPLDCNIALRTRFWNLCLQVVGGILGAVIYYLLNKKLQSLSESESSSERRCRCCGRCQRRAGEGLASRAFGPASLASATPALSTTGLLTTNSYSKTSPFSTEFEEGLYRASSHLGVQEGADLRSFGPTRAHTSPAFMDKEAMTNKIAISSFQSGRMPLAHLRSRLGESFRGPSFQPSMQHQHNANADTGKAEAPGSRGATVALSMWLGVTLDGIPEALMLGFMTKQGEMTWQFLVAIFVANFPEAFSCASLLREYGISRCKIMLMWTSVFVMTGVLSWLACWSLPEILSPFAQNVQKTATAFLEGLTGGAMFAMISTAMIPEAFHGAGVLSGSIFVLGFMASCLLQAVGVFFGEPQDYH